METPWYLDPAAAPRNAQAHDIIEQFKDEASKLFLVPKRAIFSPLRTREYVRARRYVWAKMREELGMSYPQIGRATGGYDHTTVLHGVNSQLGRESALIKRRKACANKQRRLARVVVEPVHVFEATDAAE